VHGDESEKTPRAEHRRSHVLEFHGNVDSIEDLQLFQFGAHTFIQYGAGSEAGSVLLFGVDGNQLLAQAETSFLFA
jgi:hypothetical protein